LPLSSASFLLGLLFGPEDGSDIFFQTVWAVCEIHGIGTQKTVLFTFFVIGTSKSQGQKN
jgi:hypothetical protein